MKDQATMPELDPNCTDGDHQDSPRFEIDETACQRAADIFRALGDPARLRLLVMLQQGEMCVTDIAQQMSDQISTISQRLRLLRSERLVSHRRDGKHIYYSLADDHVVHLVTNAMQHAAE